MNQSRRGRNKGTGRICWETAELSGGEIRRIYRWVVHRHGSGAQPTNLMTVEEMLNDDTFKASKSSIKYLTYFGLGDIPATIDRLIKVISEMKCLEHLTLRRASLTEVPGALRNLLKLEYLNLRDNDIKNLPDWLSELKQLQELNLWRNNLDDKTEIPLMKNLKDLNVRMNHFTKLPPNISQLVGLETLNIGDNRMLEVLPEQLTDLKSLKTINCNLCSNLRAPPMSTCEAGPEAIRNYFQQLKTGSANAQNTVIVMGAVGAGKTSIVESLRQKRRFLTPRRRHNSTGGTKIAEVVQTHDDGTGFVLFDFGGHPVYYHTYQFSVRNNSIPFFVFNIDSICLTDSAENIRTTVKDELFSFISRVYLLCPSLGLPVLAITHLDSPDPENVRKKDLLFEHLEKLKADFLEKRQKYLKRHRHASAISDTAGVSMDTFSNIGSQPLFSTDRIFCIGRQTYEPQFPNLRAHLEERVKGLGEIPQSWRNVSEYVLKCKDSYVKYEDVVKKFGPKGEEFVDDALSYLHSTGILLWFKENPKLNSYILHRFTEVAKYLECLFDHDTGAWKARFEGSDDFPVEKSFENSVKSFKKTGIISEALLEHAIKVSGTKLPAEIGLNLIMEFRLAHRPTMRPAEHRKFRKYIVPSLLLDTEMKRKKCLPRQKAVIKFFGLELPDSVFDQITVGMLNLFTDPRSNKTVYSDGLQIEDDGITANLFYRKLEQEIEVESSFDSELIGDSWEKWIRILRTLLKQVKNDWPGEHHEIHMHCGHCVVVDAKNPETEYEEWERILDKEDFDVLARTEHIISKCGICDIPALCRSPPVFPATPEQKQKYQEFIQENLGSIHREGSSLNNREQEHLPPLQSKLSSKIQVEKTTNETMKDLFQNVNKEVYPVTSPCRGRCLIINIMKYESKDDLPAPSPRIGSPIDVKEQEELWTGLNFIVVTKQNSKDIAGDIKAELKCQEEQKFGYGAFVLIMMGHGEQGHIQNASGKLENCMELLALLTPKNFPSMRANPKLVFVEACSSLPTSPLTTDAIPKMKSREAGTVGMRNGPTPDGPEFADFLAYHAAFQGPAYLHRTQGSWFFSAIARVFSENACNKHVLDMMTIVSEEVYRKHKDVKDLQSDSFRQLPFGFLVTPLRQFYMFPGLGKDKVN